MGRGVPGSLIYIKSKGVPSGEGVLTVVHAAQ